VWPHEGGKKDAVKSQDSNKEKKKKIPELALTELVGSKDSNALGERSETQCSS